MFTKTDEKGAYIELPDDDNDFVTLIKDNEGYKYRVRGDAIERLNKLENAIDELAYSTDIEKRREQLRELLEYEERNDLFNLTRAERREMQLDFEHAINVFDRINKLAE